MSTSSLTAKYRPQTFADVAGQAAVKSILSRAAEQNRVAPAYLFSGTRGVGKTTIARIFAKALNCETAPTGEPCNKCVHCRQITAGVAPDVIEIDGASNRGIEDARRLKEDIGYAPLESRYKVFIIDEAHMLTREAFNALLKTLEEPPPRVTFIMATTEAHKFPATIISRCQHYSFKMLPQQELVDHLSNILTKENVTFEPGALSIIAKRGAGSVRDSMSLLGQALAFAPENLTEQDVRSFLGLAGQDVFFSLMEAIHGRDLVVVGKTLRAILDQGVDLGFFLREFTNCWRNMFLLRQAGDSALELLDLSGEEARAWMDWAGKFPPVHIHACWQMALEGQRKVMTSMEPATALELLLYNIASMQDLLNLEHSSAGGQVPPAGAGQGAGQASGAGQGGPAGAGGQSVAGHSAGGHSAGGPQGGASISAGAHTGGNHMDGASASSASAAGEGASVRPTGPQTSAQASGQTSTQTSTQTAAQTASRNAAGMPTPPRPLDEPPSPASRVPFGTDGAEQKPSAASSSDSPQEGRDSREGQRNQAARPEQNGRAESNSRLDQNRHSDQKTPEALAPNANSRQSGQAAGSGQAATASAQAGNASAQAQQSPPWDDTPAHGSGDIASPQAQAPSGPSAASSASAPASGSDGPGGFAGDASLDIPAYMQDGPPPISEDPGFYNGFEHRPDSLEYVDDVNADEDEPQLPRPAGPRNGDGFMRFVKSRNGAGERLFHPLSHADSVDLTGDTLVVTCGTKYLKKRLEDGERLQALARFVGEYFGPSTGHRITLSEAAANRKTPEQLREEVEKSEAIRLAREMFNAQLLDVEPR